MKASTILLTSLVAMPFLACHSSVHQQLLSSKDDGAVKVVDERPKDAILSVLNADGRSAILESRGYCVGPTAISYAFKITALRRETRDTAQKLRDILGANSNMHVEQDSDHVIKIFSDDVSHDLLSVHIHRVDLSSEEQYNQNDALLAALDAPEVHDFISQHKVTLATQLNGLRSIPGSELPHMPAHIDDLTVEEYEARILQTFPGLIVYQECFLPDGRRLVSFEADGIRERQQR
jgi:hypothetical protein